MVAVGIIPIAKGETRMSKRLFAQDDSVGTDSQHRLLAARVLCRRARLRLCTATRNELNQIT